MLKRRQYDFVVVGGGFFGCYLASGLGAAGHKVALLEKESDFLQRASFANQARVHHGYHYPRSILTALRSRINFPRFVEEFSPAIVSDFRKLYAIPRRFSKVSAFQFRRFMDRIGAPLARASSKDHRLFNSDLIEEVFTCVEYAFDARVLKEIVLKRLQASKVEYLLNAKVQKVRPYQGNLQLAYRLQGSEETVFSREVINCTYSQINELLAGSGLPLISLKHELTEMALVEPPEKLRSVGVTVMCGPFFSFMPFPAANLHSLSHVRYTPHASWTDGQGPYTNAHDWYDQAQKKSRFSHMLRDSRRFMPPLADLVQKDSLWEIKTVLPQSEGDDSRPILFRRNHGLNGLTCIMGGKIDNVYDVLNEYL